MCADELSNGSPVMPVRRRRPGRAGQPRSNAAAVECTDDVVLADNQCGSTGRRSAKVVDVEVLQRLQRSVVAECGGGRLRRLVWRTAVNRDKRDRAPP